MQLCSIEVVHNVGSTSAPYSNCVYPQKMWAVFKTNVIVPENNQIPNMSRPMCKAFWLWIFISLQDWPSWIHDKAYWSLSNYPVISPFPDYDLHFWGSTQVKLLHGAQHNHFVNYWMEIICQPKRYEIIFQTKVYNLEIVALIIGIGIAFAISNLLLASYHIGHHQPDMQPMMTLPYFDLFCPNLRNNSSQYCI